MPEKLALDQVLRDGRAVHFDEGGVRSGALPVEGPGHKLLASPALARDQHGGLRPRHLANQASQLLDRPALPQKFIAGILVIGVAQELVDLQ